MLHIAHMEESIKLVPIERVHYVYAYKHVYANVCLGTYVYMYICVFVWCMYACVSMFRTKT
jgi:hypothetical protein